jgi:hypothetical protein
LGFRIGEGGLRDLSLVVGTWEGIRASAEECMSKSEGKHAKTILILPHKKKRTLNPLEIHSNNLSITP